MRINDMGLNRIMKYKGRHVKQPKAKNGADGKQAIRVTCKANSTIGLDEIHSFQGDLKILTDENFERLKNSILKYGISFPIFLWQDGKKARIIDGTQRDKVLKKMRDDGYKIPPLPIDWIEAANEKEAKEKILLATSQYGEMNSDSLMEFLNESGVDFDSASPLLNFPEIDLARFKDGWLDPQPPGVFKEIDPDNMTIEHVCPRCGYAWSGGETRQKRKIGDEKDSE